MAKNLYEIFEVFETAENDQDRINILRFNRSYALVTVLQATFDPRVQFLIDKVPYYKPGDSPPGLAYSSIHKELERIYLMIANHPRTPPTFTQQRREQILIQMLEALEAKEAVVFMNMILKDLKVKGLTKEIAKEAFPDVDFG